MDLEEVGLADRDAVKLLTLIQANGVELRNCPAYIQDWIAAERAQTNRDSQEPGT